MRKRFGWLGCGLLLSVGLLLLPGDVSGQAAWAYYPSVYWDGTLKDTQLAAAAPRSKFLLDQAAFSELWNKWSLGGPIPKVDFSRNVVVVATSTEGTLSKLRLHTIGGVGGDPVKVQVDLKKGPVDGFYYVIGVFNREKLKSIDGEPVPKVKPLDY